MIPSKFLSGIREIFLINREKKEVIQKHLITRDEDYFSQIDYFITLCKILKDEGLRVYLSINARCMDKAVWEFKKKMLEVDYSYTEWQGWYLNMDKHFRHILMQPYQRETKHYLVDIDTKDQETLKIVDDKLKEKGIDIYMAYQTPNGYHRITEPFNPKWLSLNLENVEIKNDGCMLLYANGVKTFEDE